MKKFTAAAVQFSSIPMDADANLEKAGKLVKECAARSGAQLIVLPESFTTGFTPKGGREKLWEAVSEMPGAHTDIGVGWARENGAYIVFPSYERGPDGIIWNSAALIGPDEGFIGLYRKTHPFPSERLHGDSGWTTPGGEPFCACTKIGNIGIIICYDGDFPELSRATALMGAEVIARPSAFMRTFDHWELTNKARAYDNHVYIVATNTVGYDAGGAHCFGSSMIVGPTACKLAQAACREEFVFAELDPEPLKTIYPNSSIPMSFDHLEDRNIQSYASILKPGRSPFEPALRIPYAR
jgi:predicted amidohydrolase